MSDASTTRMLEMYMDDASAPMFLSGFFQSPARNFHNSEKVEIDIQRDDQDVAVVIQDLSTGARHNESSLYTNKAFVPPIYDEQGAIHAYDLIKRSPGQDPFQDPNYGANATREAFRIFRKLENKIRRAVEWQAAQVLQTGVLTLVDENGNTLYSLDFQPKTSHHTTVGTAWAADGSTGAPLDDLATLCDTIVENGKLPPVRAIMGSTAYRRYIVSDQVQAELDNRRMENGQIKPQTRGEGAVFRGRHWCGDYELEIWTYAGRFKHPATGESTKYVDDDKVIVMADGRLDLSFGAIPRLKGPQADALPFLPPRMSDGARGLDLSVNAWFTPDNKHLMVSAGTRPLTIPTAIDTYGTLDAVAG